MLSAKQLSKATTAYPSHDPVYDFDPYEIDSSKFVEFGAGKGLMVYITSQHDFKPGSGKGLMRANPRQNINSDLPPYNTPIDFCSDPSPYEISTYCEGGYRQIFSPHSEVETQDEKTKIQPFPKGKGPMLAPKEQPSLGAGKGLIVSPSPAYTRDIRFTPAKRQYYTDSSSSSEEEDSSSSSEEEEIIYVPPYRRNVRYPPAKRQARMAEESLSDLSGDEEVLYALSCPGTEPVIQVSDLSPSDDINLDGVNFDDFDFSEIKFDVIPAPASEGESVVNHDNSSDSMESESDEDESDEDESDEDDSDEDDSDDSLNRMVLALERDMDVESDTSTDFFPTSPSDSTPSSPSDSIYTSPSDSVTTSPSHSSTDYFPTSPSDTSSNEADDEAEEEEEDDDEN